MRRVEKVRSEYLGLRREVEKAGLIGRFVVSEDSAVRLSQYVEEQKSRVETLYDLWDRGIDNTEKCIKDIIRLGRADLEKTERRWW